MDERLEQFVAEMYEKYFSAIYNYIYYQVLNADVADDLVSTVFLKVCTHVGRYDAAKSSFSTWLHTIARNVLIDYYRQKHPTLDIDDYSDTRRLSMEFEDAYRSYAEQHGQDVGALIATLNEKEQKVIKLRYFEAYNNKQIGQKLGMNASTVGTLHARALEKMLKQIKSMGIRYEEIV